MTQPEKQNPDQSNTGGLYRNAKIPVKALNIICIACIVLILVVFVAEMQHPGFTVTFDSKGGTDVPAQEYMYGQPLEIPQPPTREGYVFTGWYKDSVCYEQWDVETDTVQSDLTLYAGWEEE